MAENMEPLWKCRKCGLAYGMWVPKCFNCDNKEIEPPPKDFWAWTNEGDNSKEIDNDNDSNAESN